MSSFRIDRQYVTFVTAEAHPVYPEKSPGPESSGAPEERLLEEARVKSSQLLEQAEREADEQARRLIAEAEAGAEETLRAARSKAKKLVAEAQAETGRIREQAGREGNEEGLRQAEAEAQARKKAEAEQLQKLTEELRAEYAGLVDGMRQDVLGMVMEIVRKVIRVKLKESDEAFLAMVNDGIERLRQSGTVIIRVGPEEYARYFGSEPAERRLNGGDARLLVVEEEYAPGGLVLESEGEILDLSINRQLARVEKALRTDEE